MRVVARPRRRQGLRDDARRRARRVDGEPQPDAGRDRARARRTRERRRRSSIGAIGRRRARQRMTALGQIAPPSLAMDKPLVIAVSRALPELFAPWRKQALANLTSSPLLSAGAAFGLYRGQWRRKSYALLEAERRRANAGRPPSSSSSRCEGAEAGPVGLGRAQRPLQRTTRSLRRQLGYAPGRARRRGIGLAQHRPSRRCRAADLVDRGAFPARDRGLRVRVPGPPQARPVGLAAQPRQGRRARRLRHAGAHDRHPHGPDARRSSTEAEVHRSDRDAAPHRRSSPTSAAGSSTWRRCAYDWTEQVVPHPRARAGADAAPRRSDRTTTPPEGRPSLLAAIEAGAREGTPWDLELPLVTAKGNPRWVRARGVRDLRGRPAGAPARARSRTSPRRRPTRSSCTG